MNLEYLQHTLPPYPDKTPPPSIMSSFGSSLINKSGKKIAPKAPGRRRPGATGASKETPTPSARSSVEPSRTPQPDIIPEQAISQPSQPTSEARPIEVPSVSQSAKAPPSQAPNQSRGPLLSEDGIPIVQAAAAPTAAQDIPELHSVKESTATVSIPSTRVTGERPIVVVSTVTSARSTLPPSSTGRSKRQRVEPEVRDEVESSTGTAEITRSPSQSPLPVQSRHSETGIPVIHVRPSTSPRQPPRETDSLGLVPDEVPGLSTVEHGKGDQSRGRTSAPVTSPAPAGKPAGAKFRPKGARQDQWQITTPEDLAVSKGKRKSVNAEAVNEDDELYGQSVVTMAPEPKKIRKDKVQKRNSRAAQRRTTIQDETVQMMAEDGIPTSAVTSPITTRNGTREVTQATPATSNETPQPAETASALNSGRLKNLQKRKAKRLAQTAALNRASAAATASAIDRTIAQSLEGRLLTPSSRHEDSVATEDTTITEVAENSARRRVKRGRRAPTPEEYESVFIAENATKMVSLVGRDTEDRVGMKSEREKLMRKINWEEVNARRREENRKLAMQKGRYMEDSRDGNSNGTPAGGVENEEELDEDERLERALARQNNGAQTHLKIRLVNGEHVVDESSQYIDRHALLDEEMQGLEEVEEHDLTSRFNVHTYSTWRRKEPEERIFVNKRWTDEETETFYEALACCGTDFMMMRSWFPGRLRRQLKRKFNKEERADPKRIEAALKSHLTGKNDERGGEPTWDLGSYRLAAGISEAEMMDPRLVEEELRRERVEREVVIEEARREREEEKRQMRIAGAWVSDDEEEDGEEEEEEEEEDLPTADEVVEAAWRDVERKKEERKSRREVEMQDEMEMEDEAEMQEEDEAEEQMEEDDS